MASDRTALYRGSVRADAVADLAGPLPDSYWAAPGRLLAGPRPAGADRAALRAAVRALLDAGIRTVIDLRTPAEPPSIRALLHKLAGDLPVAYLGVPILDGAAPTDAELLCVLDAIDASMRRDRPVYLHCEGGRGRTGTVVACWWIRHGRFDPEAALAELGRRRRGQPHGAHPSPETGAQLRLVRRWARDR
ncbi:MAG TPA: tyrosine-protein phosphatase [Sandaracinaceae bacterium LLY-WYZ-13_1]|nr:tyrosine-protein phosphatase [Sandaracinaceae bacterium LLY-WYZ-13_1]